MPLPLLWHHAHHIPGGTHNLKGEIQGQRLVPKRFSMLAVPRGHELSGRLRSNAHHCSTPLGYAEITHPFHPLRGHRFPILKTRRVCGIDTLLLQGTSMGSFAVPCEWTDQGDGDPPTKTFLDFSCLSAVRDIVQSLDNTKKGVDK
jgi:hypothetical protein